MTKKQKNIASLLIVFTLLFLKGTPLLAAQQELIRVLERNDATVDFEKKMITRDNLSLTPEMKNLLEKKLEELNKKSPTPYHFKLQTLRFFTNQLQAFTVQNDFGSVVYFDVLTEPLRTGTECHIDMTANGDPSCVSPR